MAAVTSIKIGVYQMFVELKGNDGIFKSYYIGDYYKHEADELLNLTSVRKILFSKLQSDDIRVRNSTGNSTAGNRLSWDNLVGCHYIYFSMSDDPADSFYLFFTNDAMGEFHRIKRVIDENTWK